MVAKKGIIIMALWPACVEMILTNKAPTTIDNFYKKIKSARVKYVTKLRYVK
jgi:hypothetical protein